MPGFVHLHVHSSYSLLEGALTIARLAELAKADRQPALALTDTDNMFGALEFSDKMAGGRHPADRRLRAGGRFRRPGRGPARRQRPAVQRPRIVLLAAREDGYRSLMRLNSRAFLETPPNEQPHLKLAWLEGETDGLIALTGGPGGPLDAAIVGRPGRAGGRRAARRWRGCSATGSISSCSATAPRPNAPPSRRLIELAYARGIPLVAANEPLFARREDYEAHDALICIAEGPARGRDRPAPAHARAPLQDAAPKWPNCSPTCPRRSPRRSRSRSAARSGRACRRRSCRASRSARAGAAVDEAAELRKRAEAGLERRIETHGARARPQRSRNTASAWPSSST